MSALPHVALDPQQSCSADTRHKGERSGVHPSSQPPPRGTEAHAHTYLVLITVIREVLSKGLQPPPTPSRMQRSGAHLAGAPRSCHSLSSSRPGSWGPPSGPPNWSPSSGRCGWSGHRIWTFSGPPLTPLSLLSCQNP